jgi:hypothetical protein
MMNFQSYRVKSNPVQSSYPVVDYSQPDDQGNYPITGYELTDNKAALQNDLKGFGLFLRGKAQLGNKTSLNFSLYGMKEKGKNGNIEVYPDYIPCPFCFSSEVDFNTLWIAYNSYKSNHRDQLEVWGRCSIRLSGNQMDNSGDTCQSV